MSTRVYQGKESESPRPYRPSNPGTQFCRGCYPRDTWTGEATFSKLPETKSRERHFLGLEFRFIAEMFSRNSQPSFYSTGLWFVLCWLAVHYFAVYSVLGSLIKQTLTATAKSAMAV